MIPVMALPPKSVVTLPKTDSRMFVHHLFQERHYWLIIFLFWYVLICTDWYLDRFTGPMGAQLLLLYQKGYRSPLLIGP
jgi:hypothetical protein